MNAGKAYFASSSSEDKSDDTQETLEESYFPTGVNDKYGYIAPGNPVIPLTSSEDTQNAQNIPILLTSPGGNYYPDHIPAIKFDHPIQDKNDNFYYDNSPITYPEEQKLGSHNGQLEDKYANNYANYYGGSPVAEEGFIPLFLPDKSDPHANPNHQKLPEEGYKLPYYLQTKNNYETQASNYPMVYRKPPQQLPEEELPIVYSKPNILPPKMTADADLSLQSYPAVPPSEEPQKVQHEPKGYPIFGDKVRPTEASYARSTKTPPVPDAAEIQNEISTTEKEVIPQSSDYYYVYEDELPNYPASQSAEEIIEYLNSLANGPEPTAQVQDTTTERKVPTLQVEEIFPPLKEAELTSTTAATTISTTAKEDSMPIETTTKTLVTKDGQEIVYEYEYYYEYYDDPNQKREVNISDFADFEDTTEQPQEAQTEGGFSLQNLFNILTSSSTEEISTTEVTINNLGKTGSHYPPRPSNLTPRPVPKAPLRTSTEQVEKNYLESKKSTVTVETTNPRFRVTPSSTSPTYSLYPDRLDPGNVNSPVSGNNEVKWYYSNYNSQNLEPFVAPRDSRLPRDDVEAGHVTQASSASRFSFHSHLMLVLSAIFMLYWIIYISLRIIRLYFFY